MDIVFLWKFILRTIFTFVFLESNSLEFIENLNKLNTPVANVNLDSDKVILTTDDVIRLENGMEPQIYDAYVLYAEEDLNFATEIVETMESKYNLKVQKIL